MGRVVTSTLSAALLSGKSPLRIEVGWAPEPAWFFFREEMNLLLLPGMEPQFLGCPVHILVTADWAVRVAVNLHFCVRFWSRVSVVGIVTKATRWVVLGLNPSRRQGNLFFTMSAPAQRPTKPHVQCTGSSCPRTERLPHEVGHTVFWHRG
jgi:hypothetical protein